MITCTRLLMERCFITAAAAAAPFDPLTVESETRDRTEKELEENTILGGSSMKDTLPAPDSPTHCHVFLQTIPAVISSLFHKYYKRCKSQQPRNKVLFVYLCMRTKSCTFSFFAWSEYWNSSLIVFIFWHSDPWRKPFPLEMIHRNNSLHKMYINQVSFSELQFVLPSKKLLLYILCQISQLVLSYVVILISGVSERKIRHLETKKHTHSYKRRSLYGCVFFKESARPPKSENWRAEGRRSGAEPEKIMTKVHLLRELWAAASIIMILGVHRGGFRDLKYNKASWSLLKVDKYFHACPKVFFVCKLSEYTPNFKWKLTFLIQLWTRKKQFTFTEITKE